MTFLPDWVWTIDELVAHSKGFDKRPTPTLLVEGPDDVEFFHRVLKNHPAFRDNFWIMAQLGGKKTYWARQSELAFHHCVALDRDHDEPSGDPRVVYTHYYSMESYLILEPVVSSLVQRLASIADQRTYDYPNMFLKLAAIVLPLAAISWIKSEVGGQWLGLPAENVSVWKVVNHDTLNTDESRLKALLSPALTELGLSYEDAEFQYLWNQAVQSLGSCGNEDLLRIVPGKHLLAAMHRYFSENLESCVAGRKDEGFFLDLCSYAMEDQRCQDYVDAIAEVTFAL